MGFISEDGITNIVIIKAGDDVVETGLKKMGAILGDNVEVGCNSVLNPGTVIGTNTIVFGVVKSFTAINEGMRWYDVQSVADLIENLQTRIAALESD